MIARYTEYDLPSVGGMCSLKASTISSLTSGYRVAIFLVSGVRTIATWYGSRWSSFLRVYSTCRIYKFRKICSQYQFRSLPRAPVIRCTHLLRNLRGFNSGAATKTTPLPKTNKTHLSYYLPHTQVSIRGLPDVFGHPPTIRNDYPAV